MKDTPSGSRKCTFSGEQWPWRKRRGSIAMGVLCREVGGVFMKGCGRLFQTGSMIERVKSRGGENTSTFTSLKQRMKKNGVLFPNFERVWIRGKALWWLFFHPSGSLGLSPKGRRICLAFQICPLICVSEESIVPLQGKGHSWESQLRTGVLNALSEWLRAAALHLSRPCFSWAKGCFLNPATLFQKK